MSERFKTTVYLVESDYRRLKARARQRDVSAADLVREAVSEYARRASPSRKPRSIAAGRSGRRDLSERAEELLAGFGRK
jgi:hypothetical protein